MRRPAYYDIAKAASASFSQYIKELSSPQQERILKLIREGLSFRVIERITVHRRETISRYARRTRVVRETFDPKMTSSRQNIARIRTHARLYRN